MRVIECRLASVAFGMGSVKDGTTRPGIVRGKSK